MLLGLLMGFSANLTGCFSVVNPVLPLTPTLTPQADISATQTPEPVVSVAIAPINQKIPAFPGAEGFGATTIGGRGGKGI